MKFGFRTHTLTGAVLLLIGTAAQAGPVIQATSATSSLGSYSAQYLPGYAIDQSGLSAGYISGVTDFATYVATTTSVAGGSSFNTWFSSAGVLTGNFDFALGGAQTIQSFALWDDPQAALQGVNNFTLLASNTSSFATSINLGTFTALDTDIHAQVFNFAPTTASYVRMQINSNFGSTFVTGFVEGAFQGASAPPTAIPEPFTLSLFGTGLAGVVALRRRRRLAAD